jgi:hypothetical protein
MDTNEKIAAIVTLLGGKLDPELEDGALMVTWVDERKMERWDICPSFYEDADAALMLVYHMGAKGWACDLNHARPGGWMCKFIRPATRETHPDHLHIDTHGGKRWEHYPAVADTFCEAVCTAFLRVNGINV